MNTEEVNPVSNQKEDNTEAFPMNVKVKTKEEKEFEQRSVVKLSPYHFKRHKRAKEMFADAIGASSNALKEKVIDYEYFKKLQEESAKKVIRTFDLGVAIRAWNELFPQVLSIPGREIKGVPIKFQPMMDYMSRYNCPSMIVDDEAIPTKEKTDERQAEERKE